MTEQLPEDVVKFLEVAAFGDDMTHMNEAIGLLQKYLPEAETLDLYGPIKWQRTFKLPGQSYDDWSPESMNEGGGLVDVLPDDDDRLVPWPKIEGIDPRSLLNNGWQIRTMYDVPSGWAIAGSFDGSDIGDFYFANVKHVVNGIVFCRPPESDNQ